MSNIIVSLFFVTEQTDKYYRNTIKLYMWFVYFIEVKSMS